MAKQRKMNLGENTVRKSLTVSEEIWKEIEKRRDPRKGISGEDVMREALARYFGLGPGRALTPDEPRSTPGTTNVSISQNNTGPSMISSENLGYHRMLDEILGSGIPKYVDGITANLEWGSMATRVKKGERIEALRDQAPEARDEPLDALGRESKAVIERAKRAGRGTRGSKPANRKSAGGAP